MARLESFKRKRIVKHMRAKTTYSNNAYTDTHAEVLHTVTYFNDKNKQQQVQVYATDPMDAIKIVRKQKKEKTR